VLALLVVVIFFGGHADQVPHAFDRPLHFGGRIHIRQRHAEEVADESRLAGQTPVGCRETDRLATLHEVAGEPDQRHAGIGGIDRQRTRGQENGHSEQQQLRRRDAGEQQFHVWISFDAAWSRQTECTR
jgi:hypothetical protein